ncbi:hypothetical protein BU14_0713s0003 [Porphyra umbilicalis]|uniref:Uncharacterized protein n=1 Tax=Porphyra umbilicalis TaxID=2786 RepID=A0A1X6NPM5_PORUM|nr:hypothetical protein BU14_0713s0003 [Porphyra umbilicalis]|eukprot:OSX70599.1 hypothetical protein BU14_0713s0003 [Porphyra umbilicalis]
MWRLGWFRRARAGVFIAAPPSPPLLRPLAAPCTTRLAAAVPRLAGVAAARRQPRRQSPERPVANAVAGGRAASRRAGRRAASTGGEPRPVGGPLRVTAARDAATGGGDVGPTTPRPRPPLRLRRRLQRRLRRPRPLPPPVHSAADLAAGRAWPRANPAGCGRAPRP